jgi:hypothetical protein
MGGRKATTGVIVEGGGVIDPGDISRADDAYPKSLALKERPPLPIREGPV